MAKPPRPGDIVEVTWTDSELFPLGWAKPSEYRRAARRDGAERSAGYLLERRPGRHILLVLSFAPRSGTVADAVRIPWSAVRKVTVLGRNYRPARRAMRA